MKPEARIVSTFNNLVVLKYFCLLKSPVVTFCIVALRCAFVHNHNLNKKSDFSNCKMWKCFIKMNIKKTLKVFTTTSLLTDMDFKLQGKIFRIVPLFSHEAQPRKAEN